MKTFHEAMEYVVPSCPADDQGAMFAAMKQAREVHEKYKPFAKEAAAHPSFRCTAQLYMARIVADEVSVDDAMLSLFMLGLQVGMEMEKGGETLPEVRPARRRWWQIWR